MTVSFGQSFFNLLADSRRLAAFPFKKPQAIPQPDDFLLFSGVHSA
jgi:hypothetical protein